MFVWLFVAECLFTQLHIFSLAVFVQLRSSGDGAGNANCHAPFVDLEDIIGSYEQRTSDSKQSDIMEKLKALQLVEQMIKNQEHMLQTRQSNDSINNRITSEDHQIAPPRPVLNAWAETSPKKSQSPPPAPPQEPLVSSSDQSKIPRTSTFSKSAAEFKTEQLKLLNAKIAQRHCKDGRKVSKSAQDKDTSKVKKANPQFLVAKTKPKPTDVLKPIVKSSKTSQQSTKKKQLHSKKTTTGQSTSKIPAVHVTKIAHPNETTITRSIVPPVLSQPVTAPPRPTPSKHEPSFRGVPRPLSDLTTVTPINDDDLLVSTSYYVPLSEDTLDEAPLDTQFQAALERDSTIVSSDFASSLTQAYGMSSETESSQVLSMLWKEGSKSVTESNTEGRGIEETLEPITGIRPEQNRNELKECVTHHSVQLQG